ncbi:hypothetical protein B0H14DRAFT_2583865 [Mycena olivaceomarginata]|nr:hypothetical protein B0H14DRAFT_2583865 [Mycena olivaceomarginata]
MVENQPNQNITIWKAPCRARGRGVLFGYFKVCRMAPHMAGRRFQASPVVIAPEVKRNAQIPVSRPVHTTIKIHLPCDHGFFKSIQKHGRCESTSRGLRNPIIKSGKKRHGGRDERVCAGLGPVGEMGPMRGLSLQGRGQGREEEATAALAALAYVAVSRVFGRCGAFWWRVWWLLGMLEEWHVDTRPEGPRSYGGVKTGAAVNGGGVMDKGKCCKGRVK